jgi:hypothetical protein
MSTLGRLTLVVLAEMIERATALAEERPAQVLLAEAYQQGTAHLRRAGGGGNGAWQTNGLARGGLELEEQIAVRASYDLLRLRALIQTERYEALDRAVGEMALESLELHDQLWAWHTRAGTLKVALGRASTIRERPESVPTIGSGGGGKRRSSMLERLLAGLEVQEIELELSDDVLEQALELIGARGWDEQWGDDAHLLVLAHGLAKLELTDRPTGSIHPERPPSLDGLRYRVFELAETIRILEIRHTAFRIDNHGMRLRLAQLQQEVAELESALAERGSSTPEPPSRGLLGRLFRRSEK